MAETDLRKAALLLVALGPAHAAELLKDAPADAVTRLTAELMTLDTGRDPEALAAPLREFVALLQGGGPPTSAADFARRVLVGALGRDRAAAILDEVTALLQARDPFQAIRRAPAASLAAVIGGEHPQVATVILGELSPEKSAALLQALGEEVRGEAVQRMAAGASVSPEARQRIAALVRERLASRPAAGSAGAAEAPGQAEARLRRVALLLRNLRTDLRGPLLEAIEAQDADTAAAVRNLMVTWEDVASVADRSLQDILRDVDGGVLAMALMGADETVDAKVRANISERARALVDEEQSLMQKPKAEEVEAAREDILGRLREKNASGDLDFDEEAPA